MGIIDLRSGTLKGKLAGMVGAKWKETSYVRTLVTPTNPNTVDQQGVRTVFGSLIAIGKRVLVTVLDKWELPRPRNMTSLNAFIKFNAAMILAKVFTLANVKFSSGSLPNVAAVAVAGDASDGLANVTWTGGQTGVALATDPVIAIAYNETQDTWGVLDTRTRSQVSAAVPLAGALNDVVHAFVFCAQGTSITSDTTHAVGAYAA